MDQVKEHSGLGAAQVDACPGARALDVPEQSKLNRIVYQAAGLQPYLLEPAFINPYIKAGTQKSAGKARPAQLPKKHGVPKSCCTHSPPVALALARPATTKTKMAPPARASPIK